MQAFLDVDHTPLRDGASRLVLRGQIDLITAPILLKSLFRAADEGADCVELDLAGVGFMDSRGLALLLEADRSFPGAVFVTGAHGLVLRVLEAAAVAEPSRATP